MDSQTRLTTILSSNSHSYGVILFDLDGTLVDSAPDICYCVNYVMEYYGIPTVSEQYVRNWVGLGTGSLLRKILNEYESARQDITLKYDFTGAYNLFLSSYRETNGKYADLYPFVHEVLIKLSGLKIPIGIVTNRPAEFADSIISQFGLDDLIDIVVCADQFGSYKPEPDMLLYAISELGGTPEFSVMVGDSHSDIEAARHAKTMSVYVRKGYQFDVDRCELCADFSIDSLIELG